MDYCKIHPFTSTLLVTFTYNYITDSRFPDCCCISTIRIESPSKRLSKGDRKASHSILLSCSLCVIRGKENATSWIGYYSLLFNSTFIICYSFTSLRHSPPNPPSHPSADPQIPPPMLRDHPFKNEEQQTTRS